MTLTDLHRVRIYLSAPRYWPHGTLCSMGCREGYILPIPSNFSSTWEGPEFECYLGDVVPSWVSTKQAKEALVAPQPGGNQLDHFGHSYAFYDPYDLLLQTGFRCELPTTTTTTTTSTTTTSTTSTSTTLTTTALTTTTTLTTTIFLQATAPPWTSLAPWTWYPPTPAPPTPAVRKAESENDF